MKGCWRVRPAIRILTVLRVAGAVVLERQDLAIGDGSRPGGRDIALAQPDRQRRRYS